MIADKKDIKLCISTRIDLDSKVVENSLFHPVRCGAIFDKRENVQILGDHTGDNISQKRMSYCELTVIYWMWKNLQADYYGLSHYRRYLSFAEEKLPGAWQEQGFMDSMSDANLKRCGLLDEDAIRSEIESCDMIIPVEFEVEKVVTPRGTGFKTTYDYVTKAWEHLFIEKKDIDNMLTVIEADFPEYIESAREYMKGHTFRGFNIFILKKELFYSLCEFEFGVLDRMESQIDYSFASDSRKRAPGYLGEILYSIWTYHQTKNKKLNIKEKQIIFFQDTGKEKRIVDSGDCVNICYPCDYNGIPLLGVSIKSLVDNISENCNYRIIVILKNMPENKYFVMEQNRQKKLLSYIVKDYDNVTLEFIDPKDGLGEMDVRLFNEPDFKILYYRLLLPWILKEINKVVWLTSRTIVNEDVAHLYDWPLNGKSIAAAKDILAIGNLNGYNAAISRYLRKIVNLTDPHQYVDTEVMVLDLKQLRNNYSEKDIVSNFETRYWKRMDIMSDIFNVFYEDQIGILPQKWNLINRPTHEVLQCMDYAESELVKEFNVAVSSPGIINLKNHPSPWENINSDYSWEFWSSARKTPFYEQILAYQVSGLHPAIHDLQVRSGIFDNRSRVRKVADKILPINSRRRRVAKWLIPYGSYRWRFCKWIYRIMKFQFVTPIIMTEEELDEKLEEELKKDHLNDLQDQKKQKVMNT